jgi:hypothetical protein
LTARATTVVCGTGKAGREYRHVHDRRWRMRRSAVALMLGTLAAFAVAAEEEGKTVSFSLDAGAHSKYVWRGLPLTDDPALQPAFTVGCTGASLNVWANVDLTDVNDNQSEANELDLTLDYTFAVDVVECSVGAIFYTFPNTDFESTTEVYLGASFDVPASPSVRLYRDVGESDGLYATVGAGCGVPLPGDLTLDLALTLGFGDAENDDFYYRTDAAAVTDLLLTVGTTFELADGALSITPSLAFATLLDGDIVDAADAADVETSHFVVGIAVSYGF